MKIKNMRQFLVDEFSKFKIEVVELIQYVSKFKILTMNIQTYLSIALLVFLGIETNVFILSLIPGIMYTQYDYNMISYVGAILYTISLQFLLSRQVKSIKILYQTKTLKIIILTHNAIYIKLTWLHRSTRYFYYFILPIW